MLHVRIDHSGLGVVDALLEVATTSPDLIVMYDAGTPLEPRNRDCLL